MSVHLSRGTMPCIGLGVYQTPPDATAEVVNKAIHAGYRMIDTAALYRNEEGVGQGVVQSGVPREHIYITTKLWNSDHGYDNTIKACEKSLRKLNTSYVFTLTFSFALKTHSKNEHFFADRLVFDAFAVRSGDAERDMGCDGGAEAARSCARYRCV
eukprot:comp21829_c0_seq5/m.49222 comp21829_c0_seq5/g.49222  ORF comp21829_c0_seq5/g.49222 comp21829_c0_seq5/m.49222 type:complete len:156 (-) comp21829_c0_seq5:433-900(-)